MTRILLPLLFVIGTVGAAAQSTCTHHASDARAGEAAHGTAPVPGVPSSLDSDHEEIHELLSAVIAKGGETGRAAREVARRLHEHFGKEEQFALPALGLLAPLAEGRCTDGMRDAVAITDTLRAQLPQMLAEHKGIVEALGALRTAGESEGHPSAIEFADRLTVHATMEEQVFYPAALLVGERIRSCTTQHQH